MSDEIAPTPAAREYALAHATHYTGRELATALRLYGQIIDSHAGTPEAEYSRAQVANIVNVVVPKPELFDALMALARSHVEQAISLDAGSSPIAPSGPDR